MVIANDNTVASGAWWPGTPEKIQRGQEMALRLGLPVVYLVDCSGLFLPEQSRSFPGRKGAGHIFKKNSDLSAAGIPQIAGVFGDCIAGGGYMPIISDRATEAAYMVIAGAALIKGAKALQLTSLISAVRKFTYINPSARTCAFPMTPPRLHSFVQRLGRLRRLPCRFTATAQSPKPLFVQPTSLRPYCPRTTATSTTCVR